MTFSSFLSETVAFTKKTLIGKWYRWVALMLLGLPALALGQIITTKTIIDGTVIHWDAVPWTEVIPLAVAAFVCTFFVAGYIVRLLRGGDQPPEFDRPAALAFDGIRLEIVAIIWALPLFAIAILQIYTFSTRMSSLSLGSALSMVILMPVLLVGDIIILALLVFFGTVGVTRFARTGRIREAFAIRAIESDIDRIGFGGYLFVLIILVVIRFGFGIIVNLLELIPVAGFLFPLVLDPWFTVFEFRFIAGVYDAAETHAPQPAPESAPRSGPDAAHPTARDFLLSVVTLLVILAVCIVPAYAVMEAIQFPSIGGMPPMTVNELNQSTQDDISVYGDSGSLSNPQFTRDNHILYDATDCSAVTPVAGVTQASDCAADLWTMDRDGSNKVQITHDGKIPQFALDPVSGRIAFDRHVTGQNVISVIPAPGSDPAALPGPLPYMFFSSWSPDGSRIAVTGYNLSDYNGYSGYPDDKSPATGTTWSRLFVMNADGSSPQELARVGTKPFSLATESSWSPDGTELAVPLVMPGQNGIGVVTPATGSVRAITQAENPSDNIIDRKVDDYPRWSPKGDLIAFIRDGDVWTVQPDGSGLQKIVTDGTVDALAWNPDGTRLAYSAEGVLGICDPDGQNLNRIPNILPGPPSWSPDGKTITYSPASGTRIRITTLTPGVLKMEDYMAKQMDQFKTSVK